MKNTNDHSEMISCLKAGDTRSFEIIYNRFAGKLYQYVFRRVGVRETSEEIVQEIFISLWQKRHSIEIEQSLEAYLFGAAKFRILTYVRSESVRRHYAENFKAFATEQFDNSTEELMNVRELEHSISKSIATLPNKCQAVFRLSRIDHQPIGKIADKMNISRRTVENYLTQALRHLRTSLGDFLVLHLLCIFL